MTTQTDSYGHRGNLSLTCLVYTVPTHRLGHALDIVMFRPTDDIVCSTTATQSLSSDHYSAVCDLSAIKPVNHAEFKQLRNICEINLKSFRADI